MAERIRNKYAALFDSDSDDEHTAPAPAAAPEEFPALHGCRIVAAMNAREKSYSDALLTILHAAPHATQPIAPAAAADDAPTKEYDLKVKKIMSYNRHKSWADYSDSDDE
jgi:hypothetical protein